jgi:hypothetical protein
MPVRGVWKFNAPEAVLWVARLWFGYWAFGWRGAVLVALLGIEFTSK